MYFSLEKRIAEERIDDNTFIVTNDGPYDVDHSVLKFDYLPHKSLSDFKCVHIRAGEKLIVKF